jgi:hypothetical protein
MDNSITGTNHLIRTPYWIVRNAILRNIKEGSYEIREILRWLSRIYNWRSYRLRKQIAKELSNYQPVTFKAITPNLGFELYDRTNDIFVGKIVDDAERRVNEIPDGPEMYPYGYCREDILDMTTVSLESPYLQFCLQPEIIALVSSYLGEVPILQRILIWKSVPQDGELVETELFHCDGDANTQVKIQVNVTDVTELDGPLTFLNVQQSNVVRKKLSYRFSPERYRVRDDEILEILPNYKATQWIAPRGSVAFIDTSRCFHFGSRNDIKGAPRIYVSMQFVPISAVDLPLRFSAALPFRHLVGANAPLIERLVLGEC